GPGARPMNKEWVLSIREQCRGTEFHSFLSSGAVYEKPRRGESWMGVLTTSIRAETHHRCLISRNALRSPSTSSSRSGNYSAMTRRWCKLPVKRFFYFPVLCLDGFTLEGQRQHEPRREIDALHRLSWWGRFVSVVRRAVAVGAGCEI